MPNLPVGQTRNYKEPTDVKVKNNTQSVGKYVVNGGKHYNINPQDMSPHSGVTKIKNSGGCNLDVY